MSNSAQAEKGKIHVNPHYRGPEKVTIPIQTTVHSLATIDKDVELADDVTIDVGAYLGEGVKVGKGSRIERGVFLGSDVTVGEGSLIECLVIVKKGITIGSRCHITSGFITEDVPDDTMMAGAAIQGAE